MTNFTKLKNPDRRNRKIAYKGPTRLGNIIYSILIILLFLAVAYVEGGGLL